MNWEEGRQEAVQPNDSQPSILEGSSQARESEIES